jgi:hypothetical protein
VPFLPVYNTAGCDYNYQSSIGATMIYVIMYLALLAVALIFNYSASVLNERYAEWEQKIYDDQTSTPT